MEVILTSILTFAATIIGFFFGQRKNNAETDSIVIKNVKEILDVYSRTITELRDEVHSLKEKIMEYEKQIEQLNCELTAFRKEMKKPSSRSKRVLEEKNK